MNKPLPNPEEFKNHTSTLSPGRYSSDSHQSIPLEQVAKEFNGFEPISEKHMSHLLELFPLWMYENACEYDLEYFSSLMRFDKGNNSLVAAVMLNDILEESIVSYKHRFKGGVKWRTRAGTHPNNTVMHRVFDDGKPILVVEGIRDFLAGVLLGFNIIGIPTASYKGSIDIRKDDEVIFLIEDKAAYEVMMRLGKEISSVAQKIAYRIMRDTKQDLSDICFKCSSSKEVRDELSRTKTS